MFAMRRRTRAQSACQKTENQNLCHSGNQVSGAPRHRRDVVPVADNLTHCLISTQTRNQPGVTVGMATGTETSKVSPALRFAGMTTFILRGERPEDARLNACPPLPALFALERRAV